MPQAQSPPRPAQPNVIWVFGDQHRGQAVSYMGDPNLSTPNLDRLAAEGWTSTAALSGFPLCCPARGSLLTGLYPHHCVPAHLEGLPDHQPTVATVLREHGYHTAYFGKWHVGGGWHPDQGTRAVFHVVDPAKRGDFDTWIGYENNNSQFDCWVHGGEGESAYMSRLEGYETDALTDYLLAYLAERARQPNVPFFAVLSVQPPHNPYVAPEAWMQRHTPGRIILRRNVPAVPWVEERARRELAGYYAMIENLDWNVGRLRHALGSLGLEHNTHILFFSDHGDLHGSHGQFLKTNPLEESIRVPFIIGGHVPQHVHTSGFDSVLVNMVDIAPTTLGLCHVPVPDWMEGRDLSGFRLKDEPTPDRPDSAYLQCVVPTGHEDSVDRPWRGIVTDDGWKYVVLEGQPWLMFNLRDDPYEQVNMAHNRRFATERTRLQKRLAQWIAETGDDFPLPDI